MGDDPPSAKADGIFTAMVSRAHLLFIFWPWTAITREQVLGGGKEAEGGASGSPGGDSQVEIRGQGTG